MTTESPYFFFDQEELLARAEALRESYRTAHPFPHAVIDDFMDAEVLERVLSEFPAPDREAWRVYDLDTEKKLASQREEDIGPFTRHLLSQFNASAMCRFIERLTGIERLVPDPYFDGGGLHQIQPGGHLGVHVDFNRHRRMDLDRRVNLLVYLNKDWKDEYKGHLELWDKASNECAARVLPVFNRCVVFSTTSTSFHGHPEPLACPPGMTRKSLAFYYYTNGRPAEEAVDKHSTLFLRENGETFENLRSRRRKGVSKLASIVKGALRIE